MSGQPERVLEELGALFRDFFMDDRIVLEPSTTMHDVAGWDSLTNIALMLTIQRRFEVKFTARDQDALSTVGDVAGLLRTKGRSAATV